MAPTHSAPLPIPRATSNPPQALRIWSSDNHPGKALQYHQLSIDPEAIQLLTGIGVGDGDPSGLYPTSFPCEVNYYSHAYMYLPVQTIDPGDSSFENRANTLPGGDAA
ncbi:hypothetical protein FRC11_012040, partial [Ceratobasidium sp. 423]